MESIDHKGILDYKEAAEFLGIPDRVLREWVNLKFRHIPFHKLGDGKQACIGFFKEELEIWFKRSGGAFLRDKVQERPNTRRNDSYKPNSSYKPYQKKSYEGRPEPK